MTDYLLDLAIAFFLGVCVTASFTIAILAGGRAERGRGW